MAKAFETSASLLGVPEVTIVSRHSTDFGLVLLTDGMTDVLTDAQIAKVVALNESTADYNLAERMVSLGCEVAAFQARMSV